MDISPDVKVKSTINFGSVYYFVEDTFSSLEPHFFIAINTDPLNDAIVFLVCTQSKIKNVKGIRVNCPNETLVEITPSQYSELKWNSIVDCNYVKEMSIEQIVEKLSRNELKIKPEMDAAIVSQLRNGVILSPVVANRIKVLLQTD